MDLTGLAVDQLKQLIPVGNGNMNEYEIVRPHLEVRHWTCAKTNISHQRVRVKSWKALS